MPGSQDKLTEYCAGIVHAPKQKGLFWKIGGDMLRRMFNPKYYAQVDSFLSEAPTTDVKSNDGTVEATAADGQASQENIIFSLSPIEAKENPEQLKKDITEYKKLNKAINKMRNEQYRLRKTGSTEACVKKAKEDGFDLDKLVTSISRRFDLFDAEMDAQAKVLHRQFYKFKSELKLNWTFVPITHLDDLKSALNNPAVRNVIILQHSTESGQLVDSARNGYPDSFFKFLSPSLRSLTIFACHNQAIRKVYSLERNFKSANRPDRLLMTSKEFTYLSMEHVTPMEPPVFRAFLKKIDDTLASRESIPTPVEALKARPQNECLISIEGVTPTTNEFGIFVSGIYVGAIRTGHSKASFTLPCEQISKPAPGEDIDVRLMSLALANKSDAEIAKARATLTTPAAIYEFTHYESIGREDKTIYSVLFSTAR